MAFTQDFRTQRRNYTDGESRIGEKDRLWYDSNTNSIRISDGETPGGIIVGGAGGGGDYTLPTASTTIKGGVKVDGTTITISNQVISATQPDLSSYATQTYVTTRGYITSYTETDPVFLAHPANNVTNTKISNWDTAYGWGNHASAGYLTTVGTISYNDLSNKPTLFSGSYTDLTNKPTIPTSTSDLTNGAGYITSSALSGYATETYVTTRGYITSYTETDPVFVASAAYNITSTQITNWDTAYGWGDHAGAGYLTSVGTISYNDLTDKPTEFKGSIFGDDSTLLVDGINSTIPYSVLSGAPNLSAVATSGLSVAEINASNQDIINFSDITALKFDTDSGFAVTDLGNGAVKIAMNSTFKTWHVEGEENLVAEGLDDVEFVAGSGIILQTDNLASPYKQLIITTPPKTVQLFQDGILKITTGTVRWHNPGDLTISKIIFRLASAADNTVSVRIKKTGEVFSTTNISANTTKVVVENVNLQMTTDDYLTVDITAVGDTAKGSGLSVEFFYTLA